MAKISNPFLGLNKANKLIKDVVGIPVIGGRLLDDLMLISRILDFICTYQFSYDKPFADSPSIDKDVEGIELFDVNGDSIENLF